MFHKESDRQLSIISESSQTMTSALPKQIVYIQSNKTALNSHFMTSSFKQFLKQSIAFLSVSRKNIWTNHHFYTKYIRKNNRKCSKLKHLFLQEKPIFNNQTYQGRFYVFQQMQIESGIRILFLIMNQSSQDFNRHFCNINISFIKLQMSEVEQVEVPKNQEKEERKQKNKDIQQIVQLGGTDLNDKLRQYSRMTHDELLKVALQLNLENRRLKNRLGDHQPFKQRVLKPPNQQKVDKLLSETKLKKHALKVCYLGWNYDGMSCQGENDNSVEQYIFKVMHTVSLIPRSFPPDPSFTRAGRTDKGVSAMGNVICLNLRSQSSPDKSKIQYCKMMNALLPEDIRIIGCEQVSDDFNARYWCTSRRYKYYFAKGNLNIALLQQAIKQFQGTHNFINYCKINVTNTVNFQRTIFSAQVVKAPQEEALQNGDDSNQIYYFYYVGNSFLWHQIRFMSSMLFMVGLGTQPLERVKELLNGNQNTRKPNYAMAPDYPLILQDCSYQNLTFENTDPTIIYSFYNNFNRMVHKTSIQKVMIVNCMIKARQQLTLSGKITNQVFLNAVLQLSKKEEGNQCRKINKSSSRTLQQTINGLKGKKKELYLKKAEKQQAYQQRVRKQKEEQTPQQLINDQGDQLKNQSSKKRKLNQEQVNAGQQV